MKSEILIENINGRDCYVPYINNIPILSDKSFIYKLSNIRDEKGDIKIIDNIDVAESFIRIEIKKLSTNL